MTSKEYRLWSPESMHQLMKYGSERYGPVIVLILYRTPKRLRDKKDSSLKCSHLVESSQFFTCQYNRWLWLCWYLRGWTCSDRHYGSNSQLRGRFFRGFWMGLIWRLIILKMTCIMLRMKLVMMKQVAVYIWIAVSLESFQQQFAEKHSWFANLILST